ncbi:YpjP family protein [Jeotgalibacillus marinus]|uniref:YpjP family protein n=1 Tax=Jeotgalibacillus marinus TaxID=86667 RepID=A0ABV3Q3I9_9BACL
MMPNWIKNSLVVLISIITFGLVTPQDLLADRPKDDHKFDKSFSSIQSEQIEHHAVVAITPKQPKEEVIDQLMDQATVITEEKIGERLMPRIEREFQDIILPKMEQVISDLMNTYPDSNLNHLVISPAIGKGDGERIFHIMDDKTGEDVISFHVRRDRPPLEGYTFNFHYHTQKDRFESHNMLANIYWGKDTPAKFGSKMVH